MIPKIIHFCWFGDKNKIQTQFLKNRKEKLPEREIMLWNEDNFPLQDFKFAAQAHKRKKFAYVSDVARIFALQKFGGLYLDSDVEILKSFDEFLEYDSFFGFEDAILSSAVIGSQKNQSWHKKMLNFYDQDFEKNGKILVLPNTYILTNVFENIGLRPNGKTQILDNIFFGSKDFFSPKDFITGKMNISKNTFSIHHFEGSRLSKSDKQAFKILKVLKITGSYDFFQRQILKHKIGFYNRKIDGLFHKKIGK